MRFWGESAREHVLALRIAVALIRPGLLRSGQSPYARASPALTPLGVITTTNVVSRLLGARTRGCAQSHSTTSKPAKHALVRQHSLWETYKNAFTNGSVEKIEQARFWPAQFLQRTPSGERLTLNELHP